MTEARKRLKRVDYRPDPLADSPLDENGFFKDLKTHDNIHNGMICGCIACRRLVVKEISRNILSESGQDMVFRRYQRVALETHLLRREDEV